MAATPALRPRAPTSLPARVARASASAARLLSFLGAVLTLAAAPCLAAGELGAATPMAPTLTAASPSSGHAERGAYAEPRTYPDSRAYAARRETEPPRYVRTLSATACPLFDDIGWIDFGADVRARYEVRDGDLRRVEDEVDTPLLLRTRIYLGIREIIDPLRFAVEFQDARRFHGKFDDDDRDFNESELIQIFGELYFANALGSGIPLRLQAGRLAFEYVDRRLVSRNPWRNTTNTFEGLRAIVGGPGDPWQLDLLAVHPVERLLRHFDRPDRARRLFGAIFEWRDWSRVVTLQPYYLLLQEEAKGAPLGREIHTAALRGYGIIGGTGLDYDASFALQLGASAGRAHRAAGAATELGYTFDHPWAPRLSGFFGYASGDRTPSDDRTERFDRLFGFGRPWSSNDYFFWENIVAPKVRIEAQPAKSLRVEAGYHTFWLASDTDSWSAARRRDPTGESGSFIGQEVDARIRWRPLPRVEIYVGYARFFAGTFTKNTGRGDDTDFFYIETTIQLFE